MVWGKVSLPWSMPTSSEKNIPVEFYGLLQTKASLSSSFAIDQLGYPEEDKDESLVTMTRLWMNAIRTIFLFLII